MSFFTDSSLCLIPSGVKSGKVYSIVPTSGDGDLTFTRSNDTATRVGPDGLIEKVRTNQVLQSNSFDTTWTLDDATLTSGQSGYDGTNNAWLLAKTAAGGRVQESLSLSSNSHTFSVYVKAGTKNWVFLRADGTSNRTSYFDIQNGVLGTASDCIASIVSAGSGWYRCSISYVDTTTSVRIWVADADGDISGTSGNILIQAAQLEVGDVMTDYIATTTAAVSVGPVANLPRLDYSGGATCPSLLLEPQRTNKVKFSEQFDNAAWTKAAATITANAVTSPDGYTNADSFLPTATTSAHSVDPTPLIDLLGVVGTFSVFAKYNGYHLSLSIAGSSANWTGCVFDLQNGIARTPQNGSVQTACTSKIEDYGNGWYRCSITYIPYTSGAFYNYIGAASTNNATLGNFGLQSFAANGTSGAYLYGAQVETSAAYASSYIPTLSAVLTRAIDNTLTSGLSGSLPQTAGTMFWEIDYTLGSTSTMLMHNTGVSDYAFLQIGVSGTAEGGIYESGSVVDRLSYLGLTSGRYKMAFAYSTNSFALYVNGVLRDSGTSGSTASISMNTISLDWNTTDFTKVHQALLFKTRLSNADLATLTA